MKSIIFTTFPERKRICIVPDFFIFHQPRKTLLTINEKPPFSHTTLMSALNPMFTHSVVEGYDDTVKRVMAVNPDFSEYRHAQTGTLFLFHPAFFELIEPGCAWPDGMGTVEELSLVSLWNPGLWVPICEPTFKDACVKIGHGELD